jgi:uncharacterized protein (TIGR00369 family)
MAAEKDIWQEEAPGDYPDRSFLALSGKERMSGWRTGRIPAAPIVYLTEMGVGDISEGHASFTIPASPWFSNATGLIPGGVLAVLADAPLGAALGSVMEPGESFTTAELSMSFLRPVRPDPQVAPDAKQRSHRDLTRISAGGQLIHRGRTVGLTEAFLINESSEELVAFGSSRLSMFEPPGDLPEPPGDLPAFDQELPGSNPDHPLQRPLEGETVAPEVFASQPGLETLRGFISGELPAPPLSRLTGMRVVEAEEGEAVMVLPCSKWLSTSARTVQGVITAMLAEASLAAAVFSTAEAGTATAPLDLKVNYLRPVFPDGRDLTARARVVHRGRTLAVSNAELTNADGKTVALATGSAMYLPGRPADLAGVELSAPGEDEE